MTMLLAVISPGLVIVLLGIAYWFIPIGEGERSGYLVVIVLTEVMFLVILTSFVPLSQRAPILAYLFLGYVLMLVVMTGCVVALESRYDSFKESVEDRKKKKEKEESSGQNFDHERSGSASPTKI